MTFCILTHFKQDLSCLVFKCMFGTVSVPQKVFCQKETEKLYFKWVFSFFILKGILAKISVFWHWGKQERKYMLAVLKKFPFVFLDVHPTFGCGHVFCVLELMFSIIHICFLHILNKFPLVCCGKILATDWIYTLCVDRESESGISKV